jgi:hypothetical protein
MQVIACFPASPEWDGKVVSAIRAAKEVVDQKSDFHTVILLARLAPEPVPPLIEPAFSFSSLQPGFCKGPVTEEFARSYSSLDKKGGPAMNSVAGVIGTNHKSPMRPGRRHLLPPFLFSRFVHYYLGMPLKPVYDRALLLLGPKRNKVLTLEEVRQYGVDSFSDPDYVKIYGMAPAAWYRQGIRLLGRTAVECTRDPLASRIGKDIACIVARLPKTRHFTVIDPFAGSCNTLYWILRYLPSSQGMACEFDRQVYELTKRNIAGLDRTIDLQHGDYETFLTECRLSSNHGLIFFIAPPWGTALDEVAGLDLRCTTPPITDIVGFIKTTYPRQKVLVAIQVHEKLNPTSLREVQAPLDWSELRIYDLNEAGKNHGILLGTSGWEPSS